MEERLKSFNNEAMATMMAMMIRLIVFAWLSLMVGLSGSVLAGENEENEGNEEIETRYLLYIFAPDAEAEPYLMQRRNLREGKAGIKKRDLTIVEVFHNSDVIMNGRSFGSLAARSLCDDYAIMPSHFAVLLLDEDRKVRLRLLRPVKAEELFSFIDTIPLRSPKSNTDKNKV